MQNRSKLFGLALGLAGLVPTAASAVETTSATVTSLPVSLPVSPLPPAMTAAAPVAPPSPETFPPIEAQPPITFAPPLATSTHATPPRRRAPSRPPSKH